MTLYFTDFANSLRLCIVDYASEYPLPWHMSADKSKLQRLMV